MPLKQDQLHALLDALIQHPDFEFKPLKHQRRSGNWEISEIHECLGDLVIQDVGLFLERYGPLLLSEHLKYFQPLAGDPCHNLDPKHTNW